MIARVSAISVVTVVYLAVKNLNNFWGLASTQLYSRVSPF